MRQEGSFMEDKVRDEAIDETVLREIVDLDEAGVADMIAVYEGIEERYTAAAEALAPRTTQITYSTHT
jgi:hypothetical protein